MRHRVAHVLFGRGFEGNDKGQVFLGFRGKLQDGVERNVLAREDTREGGDDTWAVVNEEAEIPCAALEGDGDGFVFAEAFVGKGRDAFGRAAADFACDAHEVADDGDTGGVGTGAAAVVESVGTIFAAHPDGVVGALDAGEDGIARDESRADAQEKPFVGLAGGAEEADGVAELVRVLEVEGREAADAFGVDVGWRDLFAKSEGGQKGAFGAGVEAVEVGAGVGFGIAEALGFGENGFEGGAVAFDFGEDVVAGSVEDAVEGFDAVA